ncbi:hypothetical protein [Flavobacterium petrolei]|jgi:hypothetical protein|uniref:hypothetical protein n=1 Tax=Flavobacterium petrolei TaxID=2259594 RepID=UPI003756D57C
MNNYNQLKKSESVSSEEWKMLPMQKTTITASQQRKIAIKEQITLIYFQSNNDTEVL